MSNLVVIGFDSETESFEMRAELAKLQKEYLIENFTQFTSENVEELDCKEYEVQDVAEDYIIVEVDGEIYLIPR